MVVVAWATLVSANPSIAQDNTYTNASQQLFIDQRRLPGDTEKANPSPPTENADQLRKADEQKKLDDLAAKLKAEEEELAAREAEARKKFEELKRLSEAADVKRKSDEDRLLAREAEAQKEVAEAKRLADEARAKLQAELQKQAAPKIESDMPPAGATSEERNSRIPGPAAARGYRP
jgi:membrane protein involved in colicin uptake